MLWVLILIMFFIILFIRYLWVNYINIEIDSDKNLAMPNLFPTLHSNETIFLRNFSCIYSSISGSGMNWFDFLTEYHELNSDERRDILYAIIHLKVLENDN